MKLKPLLAVVALLAVLSAAVYFVGRPAKPTGVDPRLGQPLLTAASIDRASVLTLTENGRTVTLSKASAGGWTVQEYHGFPADFTKLSRLVSDLVGAKVERLVSQNPERIQGFNLGDARITLNDASGKAVWSLDLGKNAEGGGRLVRYDAETKAYLSRLSVFLDTDAKNWADAALLSLTSDDIAHVELSFAEAAPVVASRAKKEDPFAAADAPAGQQISRAKIDSLLSTIGTLRFSETSELTEPNAVAAKANAQTLTVKTFDGRSYTVSIGRKPEQKIMKAPEPGKAGATGPAALGSLADLAKPAAASTGTAASSSPPVPTPIESAGPAAVAGSTTETIPAGPVYAFITASDAAAPVNQLMAKRSFQVFESTFTTLPQTPADLFEPAPAPAASATPAPAPPTPGPN